jgi:tetratricopeptide (TPR) repeat protein
MPIDPYSPCPGGTGKKVKFCCSDLVSELDKVQRMLEGEQPRACLDYVRKLDEKYPDRACLQSMRVSLENMVGDHEAADATLAAFLKAHPDNVVAMAEKALAVASGGDAQGGIIWMQKAVEACGQEMPSRVYDAIGSLALVLLSAGHIVPARAHLQLQLGIAQGRDERALSALLQVEGAPTIPIPLKDMPPLEGAPASGPWRAAFQKATEDAQRGHWNRAADEWTKLTFQAAESPALWRNLATIRAYLANYSAAIDALRKFESLGVPQDDAVEAEALAQSLVKDESEGQVDELSITYTISNADEVQERLAADRRFERLPLDTSPWTSQNEPPPRAGFSILDRPLPTTGKDISREQPPHQLGQLLLFGKQTDREARLEVMLFRPELAAVQTMLAEVLGEALGKPGPETVIGHLGQVEHALSWHWRLPDDTPEELRLKLSIEQRRELVLERWPNLPLPVYGGRSAEQAAQEPQYKIRVLAGILLLQLSDADTGAETYNELRRRLGLPEIGDIDAAGLDLSRVPLARLWRVKPEALSDEQLKQAFNRAVVANFALAVRRLAPELIKRPDMPIVEYKLAAYRFQIRTAGNSEEALRLIEDARKLAEGNKQSSAPWDLMELAHRVQRGEAPEVMRLIDHIQRQHGREPGVAQALVQLLMQTGLIGPDGRLAIGGAAPAAAAAASPLVVPGAAAEPGKLWTPDGPQAGAGEKKSSLWLPD